MDNILYNDIFYEFVNDTAEKSSIEIIHVLKEIYFGQIASVVDFGCGVGNWLNAVKTIYGESTFVRGYDGDYVNRKLLNIAEEEFIASDLRFLIHTKIKYDLAICLEVGEHIEEKYTDNLVGSLIESSDLILFSSATIGQSGQGHVNCQPVDYWINKFNERGYKFYDLIRPLVWDNKRIAPWYRQNIAIYVKCESKSENLLKKDKKDITSIINPDFFLYNKDWYINKIQNSQCVQKVVAIRDYFDSLNNHNIALRMGGHHSKMLMDIIGKQNREKICCILDENRDCECLEFNKKIISLNTINDEKIDYIILSSLVHREQLLEESKGYPKHIKIIDIYNLLEESNYSADIEFWRV